MMALVTRIMLIGAALVAASSPLFGLDDFQEYYTSNVQVARSRFAEQNVARAKKDLEDKEWERCVRLIQAILDDHATGAFVTDSGQFMGIRAYCIKFLQDLPEEGQKAYRKVFDPYAKELFRSGREQLDAKILRQVFFRYQHSSYGRDALRMAAHIRFEAGQLHEGSQLAALFVDTYPQDESSPAMRGLIALALGIVGDEAGLESLRATTPEEELLAGLRAGSQSRPLGEIIAEAEKTAARLSAERSSTPLSSKLFEDVQWSVTLPLPESRRRRPYSQLDDFGYSEDSSDFSWHPVQPVLDESNVYLSNGVSVQAINIFSGQPKWHYEGIVSESQARWDINIDFPLALDRNLLFAALETPVRDQRVILNYTPQVPVPHRQLFALDASSGTMIWTHAGWNGGDAEERDFVRSLNVTSPPLVIGDKLYVSASRFHTSYHHYLCCFDRLSGALEWSTFVCTGQMEQNMFGNRVRESVAGRLSQADGVVYFSTNIGIVAAIDIRLGTLLFTTQYKQVEIPRQTRYNPSIQERAPTWLNCAPLITKDRIFVAPMDSQDLLAINRKTGRSEVLVTRKRHDRHLYVLGPYKNHIVVAGHNMTFYDVETLKRAAQLPLKSPPQAVDPSLGVQGRPLIIGNRLYAAVAEGREDQLMVWDLDRLKLIKRRPLSSEPRLSGCGNIAASDEAFVIASSNEKRTMTRVRCFFDKKKVRSRLLEEIAAQPKNPKLHLRLGELWVQEREYAAALESFERARSLASEGGVAYKEWTERARESLHNLYVEVSDAPSGRLDELDLDAFDCLERALEFARHDAQRVELSFRLLHRGVSKNEWERVETYADRILDQHADATWVHLGLFAAEVPDLPKRRFQRAGLAAVVITAASARRSGRNEEAIAYYQRLIRDYPTEFVGSATGWRYGYEQIGSLIKAEGREVYASNEAEAARLFAESESQNSVEPLQRILDLFPNSERVTRAYRAISRRLLDAGEFARAAGTVHEYLAKFGQPSGEVLSVLADSLERSGAPKAAQQTWRYVASIASRETLADDPSKTYGELAKERLGELKARRWDDEVLVPDLKLPVAAHWEKGQKGSAHDWLLVKTQGEVPAAHRDILFTTYESKLQALSLSDGALLWSCPAPSYSMPSLFWIEDRLLALLDDDLLCIDPRTGREHWRKGIESGKPLWLVGGQGRVHLLTEGRTSRLFVIESRDLLSGEIVFEYSYAAWPTGRIFASDRWVMVPVMHEPRCVVLDAFTGRPAPGIPKEGLPYRDSTLLPFLSADGMVVLMEPNPQSRTGERRLSAVDPENGRSVWTRPLGDGAVNFRIRNNSRVLAYDLIHRTSRLTAKSRDTLVVIDLLRGVELLRRTLDQNARIRDGETVKLSSKQAFTVNRRSDDSRIGVRELLVESIEIKTGARLWSSLGWSQIQHLEMQPFSSGVLIGVTESSRRRNLITNKSTLFVVDTRNGRLREDLLALDSGSAQGDIPLESLSGSVRYGENLLIADGHLVVADGPVLKVFKP